MLFFVTGLLIRACRCDMIMFTITFIITFPLLSTNSRSIKAGHLLTLQLVGNWPSRPSFWPSSEVKIAIPGNFVQGPGDEIVFLAHLFGPGPGTYSFNFFLSVCPFIVKHQTVLPCSVKLRDINVQH